jgi:RND family efflux transporter MFP subunit
VAAVESSTNSQLREVPGIVTARVGATLSSRIPASIVELPVREGDSVAAGALVVRLDSAALRSALAAAEAGLAAAEADRRRLESLASKGAATPREVEGAVARSAAAKAAVEGTKNDLSYAVLRAPWSGRVSRLPVHVGDVVSPGQPLAELESTGELEVRASVDSGLAPLASPGSRLSVRVDGIAAPLAATVKSLSPAADPSTHRFELRAGLSPSPLLHSGLFARLLFPAAAGEPRLLVPDEAIVRRGGLTGLFVVEEGNARLRWVALGSSEAGRTEIRSGIAAGEKVALDPAPLAEGGAVEEVRP